MGYRDGEENEDKKETKEPYLEPARRGDRDKKEAVVH